MSNNSKNDNPSKYRKIPKFSTIIFQEEKQELIAKINKRHGDSSFTIINKYALRVLSHASHDRAFLLFLFGVHRLLFDIVVDVEETSRQLIDEKRRAHLTTSAERLPKTWM